MNKITSVNIVCLGNWNKKIFTPKWVSSELFQLENDTPFNGVVNPDDMEFGYTHNDVLLLPKDNILEIKIEKFNKNSEIFAGELLNRILYLLPHTPIKAIGINIGYKFKKNEKNNIVKNYNSLDFKFSDFKTTQVKLTKKYDDCLLNIITDILDDEYLINFNFHYSQITKFDNNIINKKKLIIKQLVK